MNDIRTRVHDLYWESDINCARTMLICLSELFDVTLEQQTIASAAGLHGAGGFACNFKTAVRCFCSF